MARKQSKSEGKNVLKKSKKTFQKGNRSEFINLYDTGTENSQSPDPAKTYKQFKMQKPLLLIGGTKKPGFPKIIRYTADTHTISIRYFPDDGLPFESCIVDFEGSVTNVQHRLQVGLAGNTVICFTDEQHQKVLLRFFCDEAVLDSLISILQNLSSTALNVDDSDYVDAVRTFDASEDTTGSVVLKYPFPTNHDNEAAEGIISGLRELNTGGTWKVRDRPDLDAEVIDERSFASLNGTSWLTTNIVNLWMHMLGRNMQDQRVLFLKSHFYILLRNDFADGGITSENTKAMGQSVLQKQLVVVPINENNHWSLAVLLPDRIKSRSNNITAPLLILDSFPGFHNTENTKSLFTALLQKWEEQDATKKSRKSRRVKVNVISPLMPQQVATDCGVFACLYASMLLKTRDTLAVWTGKLGNFFVVGGRFWDGQANFDVRATPQNLRSSFRSLIKQLGGMQVGLSGESDETSAKDDP